MQKKILFLHIICIIIIGQDKVLGQINELVKLVNTELSDSAELDWPEKHFKYILKKKLNDIIWLHRTLKEILITAELKDRMEKSIEGYEIIRDLYGNSLDAYSTNNKTNELALADKVLDSNTGALNQLNEFHETFFGENNFFDILNTNLEALRGCSENESDQVFYYNLLMSVLAQIHRAISIINYSLSVREKYSIVTDDKDYQVDHPQLILRDTIKKFFNIMSNASRVVPQCKVRIHQADDSKRYINLEILKSNVESNYVITGLQISGFYRGDTIHIVARQHRILNFGITDALSWNWLESEDIPENRVPISDVTGIILEDIDFSAEGEVITSVGFTTVTIDDQLKLKLYVESMKFDYATGKLIPRTSNSKPKRNFEKEFTNLTAFTSTEFKSTFTETPISGIFWQEGSDGLIDLKIKTYNISINGY